MNFSFCDNIDDNSDGLEIAKRETVKLLTDFRKRVHGEHGAINRAYDNPSWLKRQIRGAARLFGGRGIIKHL
jgi:hypothetical protein